MRLSKVCPSNIRWNQTEAIMFAELQGNYPSLWNLYLSVVSQHSSYCPPIPDNCSTTYFRQNINAVNGVRSSNRHNVKFNNSERMSKQWRKLAENEKDTLPVERVGFTGCWCILEELCDHLQWHIAQDWAWWRFRDEQTFTPVLRLLIITREKTLRYNLVWLKI